MKTKNKFYWCLLLLLPAIAYYLILLSIPDKLVGLFLYGFPLSIALGLIVMLWVVGITFLYVLTLVCEIKKTTNETDNH